MPSAPAHTSITVSDQRHEAIKRACRMIVVEAGLSTVQADRIRTHVQDILAAAADLEQELTSASPWSNPASW